MATPSDFLSPIDAAVQAFGSQRALAAAIGVTQAAVSKWVNGHGISLDSALAIETATGGRVKPADLARGRFPDPPAQLDQAA